LRGGWGRWTYVGSSELLLGGNDTTAALSGVQGAVALDDSLARAGSAATGLAANLGDLVPVRHGEYEMCGVWLEGCVERCVVVRLYGRLMR
jgi:hypothetical protein